MDHVDWNKWLPPRGFDLPNTGPKVFKAGQVWASHRYGGLVFRVNPGNNYPDVLAIADNHNPVYTTGCIYATGEDTGCISILVADVGCEPTDPDLLYQAFYK